MSRVTEHHCVSLLFVAGIGERGLAIAACCTRCLCVRAKLEKAIHSGRGMRTGFGFLFHVDQVWLKPCRILAATSSILAFLSGCAGTSVATTYVNGTRVFASKVCIELNPTVYDQPFLPSLQIALQNRGVSSEIFNPGVTPATCQTRMVYNVAIGYSDPASGQGPVSDWFVVDITVLQYNQIVASAHYEGRNLRNSRVEMQVIAGMIKRLISAGHG